jgi:hypothetical protein
MPANIITITMISYRRTEPQSHMADLPLLLKINWLQEEKQQILTTQAPLKSEETHTQDLSKIQLN